MGQIIVPVLIVFFCRRLSGFWMIPMTTRTHAIQVTTYTSLSLSLGPPGPNPPNFSKIFIWGVVKGSSVSWVAKFKGDKISECRLSNGWSRSYKVIKLFFLHGNEWSRSYGEIDQHLNLPWNVITHGFLDPSAFPDCWVFRPQMSSKCRENNHTYFRKLAWLPLQSLAVKKKHFFFCVNFGR